MFTKQAPVYRQQLEQAGFSTEQASAMVSMIGQCMSSLEHRGPVSFTGPVSFAQMPKMGGAGIIQLAQLQDDLTSSNPVRSVKAVMSSWYPDGVRRDGAEIDVWPGPFINASESEFIPGGSSVGVIDVNGFKCPIGSSSCPER